MRAEEAVTEYHLRFMNMHVFVRVYNLWESNTLCQVTEFLAQSKQVKQTIDPTRDFHMRTITGPTAPTGTLEFP